MRPVRNFKTNQCCHLISGIASVNFFTARYLTPLAKAGYIAVAGGEKNRFSPGKQYKLLRKGEAVVDA